MQPRWFSFRNVAALVLLLLAATHCATSVFFTNYSYLDLKAYAAGTERMPYQARSAMMPVIRLAERSTQFVSKANHIQNDFLLHHPQSHFRDLSPESLACMIAGIVSCWIAVLFTAGYGVRRFGRLWWLPPSLFLAMLFVTQAARYETALWYPYDLPHDATFGICCLLLLEGWWLPALLVFAVDLPIRETSMFLILIAFAIAYAKGRWKTGLALGAIMAAAWGTYYFYTFHLYRSNPTEVGHRYHGTLVLLRNPINWPQTASAFGFMLLPLFLGNRLLPRTYRIFLLAMVPCLLFTLNYGVWSETRIFGEWLIPASVLLAFEGIEYIAKSRGVGLEASQGLRS